MTSLHPKGTARERLLLIGGAGTGKTTAHLSIAKKVPTSKFFVLDSDFAIDRMIENENLPNVEHRLAIEWTDYVEGVKEYQAKMTTDDWLVIDFLSPAWDAVQAWYVDQIHGKDIDAYFIEARKKKTKGNPLDGDTDWGIINKAYKAFVNILLRTPGHILCTAPAKAIGERDDPQLKATFGAYGVRPEGQKHTAHVFHTILWMTKTRVGEYQMTTIKDRGRREVEKAPVADFAGSYLMAVAGWRPGS